MAERSEELLSLLAAKERAPVAALLALAEERRVQGRDTEAIALFERAVEAAPDAAAPRRTLVELLEKGAAWAQVELHVRRLLDTNPDDARLRVDLAHALHAQGRRSEAAAELSRVRSLPLDDPAERKAIWSYSQRRGLGAYLDAAPPG
jgi:thioredoxin-like negative regulator of GroEL